MFIVPPSRLTLLRATKVRITSWGLSSSTRRAIGRESNSVELAVDPFDNTPMRILFFKWQLIPKEKAPKYNVANRSHCHAV